LSLLENRGYNVGILTNWPRQKTLQKIAYLWWEAGSMVMVLHSENMAYEKPDPRVFDYVFNKIWREYDDLIYVWDSIEDYKASRWAGVKFYWVLTWYTSKSEFVSHGLDPSKVLDNINDLILSID
jgi:phosphoglycolate phosphatase-like HAD superfamily hydrolase